MPLIFRPQKLFTQPRREPKTADVNHRLVGSGGKVKTDTDLSPAKPTAPSTGKQPKDLGQGKARGNGKHNRRNGRIQTVCSRRLC